MAVPYKISAVLTGHTQDVRCVASTSTPSTGLPVILSSSRDSTARAWIPVKDSSQPSNAWKTIHVWTAHENFVGAVTTTKLADGREVAVTGSNDAIICVWDLSEQKSSEVAEADVTSTPLKALVGHTANVCSLNGRDDGWIVSGSWDCTAKVWNLNDPSGEPKYTLKGSELSIWSVLFLPSASSSELLTLTASADKLIRMYSNDKLIQTFKGHTQPVRSLSLLPTNPELFISCSNDSSIKVWNFTNQSLVKSIDNAHDSFIYDVIALQDGTLVSSGEDRSVRIWNKDTLELQQVITVPAISVWSVANIKGTSDLVVGSSDSQIRIFTQDPARAAALDVQQSYSESIAASSINTNQISSSADGTAANGKIKKTDLPTTAILAEKKGKREGEVLLAKNEVTGNVEAYQWSIAQGDWINLGQVVDEGSSSDSKIHFEGKEYDYVFDVDVAEGAPPLKLPYNVAQNPYEAAQNFLNKHELPQSYIEQVVQFIEKNTGGIALGGSTNASQYVDPYTGASSYRSNSAGTTHANAPSSTNSGFSGDPWSTGSSAATSSLLPYKTFLNFPQANVSAIQKKIFDLNLQLSNEPTTATEFPLDTADITTLQASIASLTSSPTSFTLDDATLTVLEKLLEWPSSARFPAIDLIRVIVFTAAPNTRLANILFPLLSNLSTNSSATVKENETNSMLALRALCNLFVKNKAILVENAAEVLETLSVVGTAELSKLGKTALATAALNFSVLSAEGSLSGTSIDLLLDVLEHLLKEADPETVYRTTMALGNVVYTAKDKKTNVTAAKEAELKATAKTLGASGETRTKDLLRDIEKKL